MCQRIGRPPISTIGLGRDSVSSRSLVPKPPQRMTTFTSESPLNDSGRPTADVPPATRAARSARQSQQSLSRVQQAGLLLIGRNVPPGHHHGFLPMVRIVLRCWAHGGVDPTVVHRNVGPREAPQDGGPSFSTSAWSSRRHQTGRGPVQLSVTDRLPWTGILSCPGATQPRRSCRPSEGAGARLVDKVEHSNQESSTLP